MNGAGASAWLADKRARAADRVALSHTYGLGQDPADLALVLPAESWSDEDTEREGYSSRAEAAVDAAVNGWWRDVAGGAA